MEISSVAPLADVAALALGSLFALLLWVTRRGNHSANRWLAGCAACLALLSLGDLLEDTRWVLIYPSLAHTTDWMIFAVGPCVWLYVRRLTMSPSPRAWRTTVHFIPAAICLLLLLPYHLASGEQQRELIAAELAERSQPVDPLVALAVLHMLAYWVASLLTLRRFASGLKQRYSSIEERSFRWIAWVLGVTLLMWLFWLLGLALESSWAAWLDLAAIPAGLYVLAFAGLRQPAVFLDELTALEGQPTDAANRATGAGPSVEPLGSSASVQPPAAEAGPRRYARSGLDATRLAELRTRLDELMRLEKPWLENDLTLAQLAARLNAPPQHLSQVLNEVIGLSFFDYVNSRRVMEVQRCLGDPAYAGQTLLEVAFAAGFNSKAAFNAAFKKHTGLTPSQFRNGSPAARPGSP